MLDFLDKHNILLDSQHGFRSRRSCDTQLSIATQNIANNINENRQTDAVILDFEKAFDKVPHHHLALKLQHYGIHGPLLHWFRSFLGGRQQQVLVDGAMSGAAPVLSGVPQGTVVGPLLFLLYINDINTNIQSSIRLFADDCLIYRQIESHADQDILQQDLEHLQTWADKWLMSFNVKTCFVMQFGLSRRKQKWDYVMKQQALAHTPDSTYLGVTLNHKLHWKPHIESMCSKSNKILGFIRRNLRGTPQSIKEKAYKTIVRPVLS